MIASAIIVAAIRDAPKDTKTSLNIVAPIIMPTPDAANFVDFVIFSPFVKKNKE